MKKIIGFFIAWRIFLFFPLIASEFILPSRINYSYTLLTYFLNKSDNLISNFLVFPFGNFDGAYYLLIASNGYTVNAGFFPLFPISINFIASILGVTFFSMTNYFVIGILLVSIYFLLSLIFLFKLIKLDYKDNIAILSIFFLLVFPTSFFYASIYSESLFLLLSTLSFYFARKKKWFLVGLFGALLSSTRIVGIAILPSVIYEYFKEEKDKFKVKMLSLFLIPIGLLGYMYFNLYKWGSPLYFIEAQGNFQNNREVGSIILFPQTIIRYIKILMSLRPNIYEWWVAFSELAFFIFTLIMLIVALNKKIRFSYILFGFLLLLIPASTGTFTGIPRYVAVIFPMFIVISLIKNTYFKIFYTVFSIFLLFIFFTLFSKGYFIG